MFEGAEKLRFQDFELVVLRDTKPFRKDLKALEGELLELASYARGWEQKDLPRMRAVFKFEPFYLATSLVLVFQNTRLYGTAGVDVDFEVAPGQGHILHLCSVNLRKPLRNSALMARLFVLLADHILAKIPADHEIYFTSISQSPAVYSLISKIARLYPNGEEVPPDNVKDVARRVVAKYDPHLTLETDTLILRNECDFFYKDVPYVSDPKINGLFDRMLDIAAGDVFVNVAKSTVQRAVSKIDRYRNRGHAMEREI